MNRQQTAEVFEARRKVVAERILRNLSHSPEHADLAPFGRMELADKLSLEIMNTSPDELTDLPTFPGLGPDGFFTEQE